MPIIRSDMIRAELTSCSAAKLATMILARQVSSVEVVESHLQRLAAIAESVNGMSVTRYDAARYEAAAADRLLASGLPVGPLHGVPITVKDSFAVAETTASIGLTHDRVQTATEDAPLVRRLRQAGAIVLGKTNVPQLMFSHECYNPLHGRTRNPWSNERTAGGSSGGEAAVVAAGGSPLGLGSDLGGSIRVPCHFCGVAGIKPTSGRLTKRGSLLTLRGLTAISYQPGPIARCVDDLNLALSVLSGRSSDELDFDAPPIALQDYRDVDISRLRVGVIRSHDFFPAAPPIVHAVDAAAATIAAAGADVVEFELPDFEQAIGCYLQIMSADGGADLRRVLRGSLVAPGIGRTLLLSRLPQVVRQPLARLLGIAGQRHWSYTLRNSGPRSADAAWQAAYFRKAYTEQVVQAMRQRGIDALVMPPHALPALRHGQALELILAACYAYWANLLEMPAGTVPISRIGPEDTFSERRPAYDVVNRAAHRAETDALGLPVGVQVVGTHWREDIVLALLSAVEAAAEFEFPPVRSTGTRQPRRAPLSGSFEN